MGIDGERSARDALLATTIEHLAVRGPVGVQPQEICAELGISKALVNYHFGGREGLVAEAIATASEQHADRMAELAGRIDDGVSPAAALEALIEFQVQWAGAHPGLAAAATYPEIAVGRGSFTAVQQSRMAATAARNIASVQRVLLATRRELSGGQGFDSDDQAVQMTAIVGWITLGMLTWNAGRFVHGRSDEVQAHFDHARAQLHCLMRDALAR